MRLDIPSYGERNDAVLKTWIALLRASKNIHAKEQRYVQRFGISMGQFEVLEVLFHRGALRVGEITALIGSTPGNVTVVVKNLVKSGLITSQKSEHDKRVVLNSITPEGEALMSDMFTQHVENLADAFHLIDDEELKTLFTLLRRLHKSNR